LSIYNTSSIGTTANQITFNANTIFPVYRVISRMPQRRQIRELDIPVPFENGISDFETLIGQTAYVIEGIMYPGGESDYDAGLRALRKLASLDLSQDDVLSDEGYVPYTITDYGNATKIIYMKVLYVDIQESTRKGLVQPFRLVCKIKDPTIYGGTVQIASTQPASFTVATGTAIFPVKFPFIFGASTSSVSAGATNAGDIPVYPISINIFGPVNHPTLTNTTTGEFISVDTNLATASDQLIISYDKDSLLVENNGNSVLSSVSTASTYFKLQPDTNIFTLTGTSISSGAYATISYRDGYAL
jgi:hypothetical protein